MYDYFLHTWNREQPGVFFKFHFLKGNISIFQCMFVLFFTLLAAIGFHSSLRGNEISGMKINQQTPQTCLS